MSPNNDYIEINQNFYRVEFNWDAITNFLEAENLKLENLDELATFKPSQLSRLCYEGIVAGCKVDALERNKNDGFPYSFAEFVSAIRVKHITDLLLIYQYHTTGDKELKKKIPQPKPRRMLFRFRKSKK